jgi:TonB family protein
MDSFNLGMLARDLSTRMADASVRALVLGLLAFLLVVFIRRSSTTQHAVWMLVLAGMLALPFLRPVVPATHVRLPQALTPQPAKITPAHLSAKPYGTPPPIVISPERTEPLPVPRWPLFLLAAYLVGVMLFGARLLFGVLLTRRALRNTRTIHSELWEHWDLIADTNVDLNLEESDRVRVPLTAGFELTRVIFPADWREWPAEKRTAVLAHELAHAGRRDPLIALLAAVNKCLFWFHPLAWWLERRLAVLAEHAADDAALAVSFDVQAYARLLLDSAAQLHNGGNRLIWHSAAMSGPVVAERIRRVLDVSTAKRLKPLGKIGGALLVSLGAMLIWIATAVDVPGLAAGQANNLAGVDTGWPPWVPTVEQAATLEQELAADPENETVRKNLLQYYWFTKMCAEVSKRGLKLAPGCDSVPKQAADHTVPLVLWLIDHHPESQAFDNSPAWISPQRYGADAYEEARQHWLTQVNLHPNDARVLGHAAGAFGFGSQVAGGQERLDLLKRAQKLDPEHHSEPLAMEYSFILVGANDGGAQGNPGLAAQIRNEVQSSNDIALVGSVARHVVEGAAGAAMAHPSNWDSTGLRLLATELVTHAQKLEPQNREWSDLMEGVNRLPAGTVPPAARSTAGVAVETIRVGGMVSKANLQESPTPEYPPLAKAAGVQGTVKLQIRIGADGHVKEATAISGHPLLIQAAKDAALRYVYKPTMLNGKAAEVLTDVEIVFRETQ